MAAGKPTGNEEDLPAGRLCLAFANTVDWRAGEAPEETLFDYHDLLDWAQAAGALTAGQSRQLRRAAQADPQAAERAFSQALRTREVIYRVFSTLAAGRTPGEPDLAALQAAFHRALPHTHLVHTPGGFRQEWSPQEDGLEQALWPVVRSAVALLTSPELDRVGQCADDRGCGYLFFDQSRNRSRRWCDMQACGNRAKARRHYRRQKSQGQNSI